MYSSKSSLPSKLYYFGKEGIVDILFIQKLEFLIRKTHSGTSSYSFTVFPVFLLSFVRFSNSLSCVGLSVM